MDWNGMRRVVVVQPSHIYIDTEVVAEAQRLTWHERVGVCCPAEGQLAVRSHPLF